MLFLMLLKGNLPRVLFKVEMHKNEVINNGLTGYYTC